MRILYFSPGFTQHDHRFLSALSGTDNQVYFLQMESDEMKLETRSVPELIEEIRWPSRSDGSRQTYPAMRKILKKILADLKPDLVHAGPLHESAFLCALAGFKPLVSMSWGSDILWQAKHNRLIRWMTNYTLKRTSVLVGDCQAVANEAMKYCFPAERIVLFPWGVNLKHFSPIVQANIRKELEWEDKFVILSMRSWEPIYGVEHLVKGFIAAARKIPELRLLLLGGGSQASLIRSLIIEAEMQDRVHFGGRIGQGYLPGFYRSADLYASASFSDGSSVSLMEALACGVPALVSDIEGNREWVEAGEQGWLFPAGDVAAISDGIQKAYHNRGDVEAMRCRARKTAEERADWSLNFPKLLDAYQMALLETPH